jgi:hypothetical protein
VDSAVADPKDISNLCLQKIVVWLHGHAQKDHGQGLIDFISKGWRC